MFRTRDLMQRDVATVRSSLPVTELEQILVSEGISGMPVIDDGELCGVVSRSDVIRATASAEGNAGATLAYYQEIAGTVPVPSSATHMASERIAALTVRDIMTRELIAVAGDQPVREVAQTMVSRGVHRVLVTAGRHLLGIITTLDLARAIADGRIGG
jgi:CBS domain-containing protein